MYGANRQLSTFTIPGNTTLNVDCTLDQFNRMLDKMDRRLYLYGSIMTADDEEFNMVGSSMVSDLVEKIMEYNRADRDSGLELEERKPIRLYINSPGGVVSEGFQLIDAIEASKTPVYTINTGEWSSMSFLIGITGKKRYSLRHSTFLLHDGSSFVGGSTSKVKDRVMFDARFEAEVIKSHVLDHSCMSEEEYDNISRNEFYMLPEDALRYNFIDEIIGDLDTIL